MSNTTSWVIYLNLKFYVFLPGVEKIVQCKMSYVQTLGRSSLPWQCIFQTMGRVSYCLLGHTHTQTVIYIQLLANINPVLQILNVFLTYSNNKKLDNIFNIYKINSSIEGHLKSRICSTDCIQYFPAFGWYSLKPFTVQDTIYKHLTFNINMEIPTVNKICKTVLEPNLYGKTSHFVIWWGRRVGKVKFYSWILSGWNLFFPQPNKKVC